jgi:hypothetical protein
MSKYTQVVVVSLVVGTVLAGRMGAQGPDSSGAAPVPGAWTPRIIATSRPVAEAEPPPPVVVQPQHRPAPEVAPVAKKESDQVRLVADPPKTAAAPPPPRATPAGAGLVVEKVGPTTLASGKPLVYEVIVRNPGGAAAEHVRVEEQISPGSTMTATEPRAEVRGNTLVWDLGRLAAGADARLHVTLQPSADGEVSTTATVTCATVSTLRTRIVRPGLVLSFSDPPAASIGQKVTFQLQMANNTATPLTKLTLHVGLSAGLRHPEGAQIEATIPSLGAGELQTVPLEVVAAKAGRQVLTASLAAAGVGSSNAEGAVEVTEVAAAAPTPGPVPAAVTRSPEVRPTPPPAPAPQTEPKLPSTPPVLPPAPAPQPQPKPPPTPPPLLEPPPELPMPGPPPQSRAVPPAQAGKPIASVGGPAVTLDLRDSDPAVEVGKETTYEIRVLNQGAAPTREVLVQAVVPDEMALLKADGPGGQQGQVQGNRVAFGPLASLDGQDQAVYRVRVKALKPGDGRFTASLQCEAMARPLSHEVETHVYSDQGSSGGTAEQ